ncbi:MAG TPA: hypothetical protein VK890_10105, partial [Bacteroidia bacterium]|nr:hypothetical protein [Bacteroidia bacterium]
MMIRLYKKLLYLIIPVLFICNNTYAQTWSPVGNGTYGGYVYSLCAYDSVLYAGGTFIGPGNHIAQWDGNTWQSLGSGTDGDVYSMCVYKGSLYAGGWFSSAGGHSVLNSAGWNGDSWSTLPNGFGWGIVDAIDTFSHDLYFVTSSGYIAYWNNKIWQYVSNSSYSFSPNAMAVYQSNLYVAGWGTIKHGLMTIYGTVVGYVYEYITSTKKWQQIAVFPDSYNMTNITCLTVYNNNLYIGGTFDSANGKPANNIATWNGD